MPGATVELKYDPPIAADQKPSLISPRSAEISMASASADRITLQNTSPYFVPYSVVLVPLKLAIAAQMPWKKMINDAGGVLPLLHQMFGKGQK